MALQYITHDKVKLDKLAYVPYLCEDQSVKHSEKIVQKSC